MKTSLIFSAAAMFVAVCGACRTPTATTAPVKIPLEVSEESSLAVSPDGQNLAVGGGISTDTVLLYSRRTRQTRVLRLTGKMFAPPRPENEIDPFSYYMSAVSLQFSPDGRTLVNGGSAVDGAVGENGSLNLWDAHMGKHLRWLGMGLVTGPAVVFSPDGKIVACSGEDMKTPRAAFGKEIRFWHVETGKPAGTIQANEFISALRFSPNGRLLATGSTIPTPFVQVWNVRTHRRMWSQRLPGNFPLVTSVCFSPDGNLVATGSQEGVVCLWEAKSGRLKSTLIAAHNRSSFYRSSSPDAARMVMFSSNGRRLASAGPAGVNVWSMETEKQMQTFQGVMPIAFLPDGRHLISADASRTGPSHLVIWTIR